MVLECTPFPNNTLKDNFDSPWCGITYVLENPQNNYSIYFLNDLGNDESFEFYAKSIGNCRLNIDIGTINEDIALNGGPPNGKLDSEDRLVDGRRDGNLDNTEDLGVDGLPDESEIYIIPNDTRDGWDSLRFLDPLLSNPFDPAGDNYSRDDEEHLTGTEGNSRFNWYPESEDIDSTNYLSTWESIARWSIDFKSDTIDTSPWSHFLINDNNVNAGNGWNHFKFDFDYSNDNVIGAEWRGVKFIRLWLTGFDRTALSPNVSVKF